MKPEPTKNLVAALRQIANDLICDDGVANEVLGECADRMQALAELTAKQNDQIERLKEIGDIMAKDVEKPAAEAWHNIKAIL